MDTELRGWLKTTITRPLVLTDDILAVKVVAIVEFFAVPFFKGARTIIGWIVSWNLVTVLKPPLIEPLTVTV